MYNWMVMVTGGALLAGLMIGFARGAVKIAVSLLTAMATFVLVFWLTPYVSRGITAVTPAQERLETRIESAVTGLIGAGDEEGETLTEDAEVSREVQAEAIERAELPGIFKELLLTNNNSEIYDKLGVTRFVSYVAAYLAKLVIHVAAFLITFLLVFVGLRIVIVSLDLVSELPVVGFVNRLAGGVLGVLLVLVLVWVFFLLLTLLYAAGIGQGLFEMIQESGFLRTLYEYSPVLRLATAIRF